MDTLEDVKILITKLNTSDDLFNVSPTLRGEFHTHIRAIGRAICKERKLTKDQAFGLPDDTPLGVKSKDLYLNLRIFYEQQMEKK